MKRLSTLALAGLFLYQVLVGAASPAVYATAQIMAGPATAGRWVGIQNALGNVAGHGMYGGQRGERQPWRLPPNLEDKPAREFELWHHRRVRSQ